MGLTVRGDVDVDVRPTVQPLSTGAVTKSQFGFEDKRSQAKKGSPQQINKPLLPDASEKHSSHEPDGDHNKFTLIGMSLSNW